MRSILILVFWCYNTVVLPCLRWLNTFGCIKGGTFVYVKKEGSSNVMATTKPSLWVDIPVTWYIPGEGTDLLRTDLYSAVVYLETGTSPTHEVALVTTTETKHMYVPFCYTHSYHMAMEYLQSRYDVMVDVNEEPWNDREYYLCRQGDNMYQFCIKEYLPSLQC